MPTTYSPHQGELPADLPLPLTAALATIDALSDREAEVFVLLAHAPSYKELAQQLGISRRTVRFHVEKIRHKLGLLQYHQLCAASYLHRLTTASARGRAQVPGRRP